MKPINVSQLNSYIKRILQTDPLLGQISVIGEISNLKYHQNGHVYFSLKDKGSKINCFLPSNHLLNLRYELEEGMEVTVNGSVNVYEPGGYYSLSITTVAVEGFGSLSIAFNKLKEKLEKQGLFDVKYKKPLPKFPKHIGLVTGATGAAIKDMLKIIQSKNNFVDISIFPVMVQGDKAAPEISETLARINNKYPQIDLIILGRGGGSVEDLWAFNEEAVALSIFNSKIPIISAVGHESDVSIADYVSDRRAETPTAAAHMAVPDIFELQEKMQKTKEQLTRTLNIYLQKLKTKVEGNSPIGFINYINRVIENEDLKIQNNLNQIHSAMVKVLDNLSNKVENLKIGLEGKNPIEILDRGYSIVVDENQNIIKEPASITNNQKLTLIMADFHVQVVVQSITKTRRIEHEQ